MVNNKIEIQSSGDFLDFFKFPNRIKQLAIEFSNSERLEWSDSVYEELATQIGVYGIINSDNDIIYFGKATGANGLKGRHHNHEKNEVFKLFDAKEIIIFHGVGKDLDEPGALLLIERLVIYCQEPTLNDDVKGGINLQYIIGRQALKKLIPVIDHFTFNHRDEEADLCQDMYDLLEHLIIQAEDLEKKYQEALSTAKKNYILEDRRKIFNEKMKELKNFISENIKNINDLYEEYGDSD